MDSSQNEVKTFENVIELQHISKSFPGIKANDDISLTLRKGEIHALLGENGAGKSTLMSILFGLYEPDEGQILVNGNPVKIHNPNEATALHIGMVHQHFKLVECYTALQNIILGSEPVTKHFGFLKPKAVRESLEALCKKYKFNIDLDAKIEDMSVGSQQKVEILKMLYRDNDILIFDEPTAVLTPQEIYDLMISMKELIKEGKSILFISHKLNEIMAVADRVTILSKGRCLGTLNVKDTNAHELSRLMVGRDVQLVTVKDECKPGKTVLSIKDLTMYNSDKKKNVVNDVSFDVRQGEIVCIAGIEGNGQSELIYGITGIEPVVSGEIILRDVDMHHYFHTDENGKEDTLRRFFGLLGFKTKAFFYNLGHDIKKLCYPITIRVSAFFKNTGNAIKVFFKKIGKKEFTYEKIDYKSLKGKTYEYKPITTKDKLFKPVPVEKYQDLHLENLTIRKRAYAGVSHIPEDRHRYGLALDFSLRDNLVLQKYFERPYEHFGFTNEKAKHEYATSIIDEYDVRCSLGDRTLVRSMSGGNQQKAILGREIDRGCPLLIAVQPTRGLDVGAIEDIHKKLIAQRDNGKAVLLVSLELDEVMNLADKILVMFNGEIVAALNPKLTTANEIGLYMSGGKRMTKEEIDNYGK